MRARARSQLGGPVGQRVQLTLDTAERVAWCLACGNIGLLSEKIIENREHREKWCDHMNPRLAERPPWLVRIRRTRGDSPVGAGILISDTSVITCAHVISSSLNSDPPEDQVYVEFQFASVHQPIPAVVAPGGWYPESNRTADVAVLELREAKPDDAYPVSLRSTESGIWDHRFHTYGYPKGHEEGGVPARGVIVGAAENEWIQLQADSVLGYSLEAGFSGAPVWDINLNSVIGMVVARDRPRGDKGDPRTGYAIPTDVLLRYWPDLTPAVPIYSAVRGYVPPLPVDYIARPAQLEELVQHLLARLDGSLTGPIVTLCGMGGVGKSVLAALAVRDPAIQAAFPDGIVWLELGREPQIIDRQAELAAALGENVPSFVDWRVGRAILADLVRGRRVLLVLDNVWRPEDLAPFEVIGSSGACLVTSRIARLTDTRHEMTLDVLDAESAMRLLARRAGQDVSNLPEVATEVATRCGGLPLALAVAGSMAAQPGGWRAAVHRLKSAKLDRLRARFASYPYPNLLSALAASVDDLDKADLGIRDLRQRYLDLAVFSGTPGPIPHTALEALWKPMGLDSSDVADLIDVLAEKSLLTRDESGAVWLHDLQMDLLVATTEHQWPALNEQLLAGYGIGSDWRNLRDDGYIHHNLARHLYQADRTAEAANLLTDLDWLLHRSTADDIPSLLADMERLSDRQLERLARVMRLAAPLLRTNEDLPGQLLGRLEPGYSDTRLTGLLSNARDWNGATWLRPIAPTLMSADDVLDATFHHPPSAEAVTADWDAGTVISAAPDGTVRNWRLGSAVPTEIFETSSCDSHVFGLSGDGKRILIGERGEPDERRWIRRLRIFNVRTREMILDEDVAVYRAALSHNGRWAAWATAGFGMAVEDTNVLTLFDIDSGRRQSFPQEDQVEELDFSPSGDRLAIGYYTGKIVVMLTADGHEVYSIPASERSEKGDRGWQTLAIAEDGRLLISMGRKIVRFPTGQVVAEERHVGLGIYQLAVDGTDGRWVAYTYENNLSVWDSYNSRRVGTAKLGGQSQALAISPNGEKVVTGDRYGTVSFWRFTTDHEMAEEEVADSIASLGTSSSGKIVGTEYFGRLREWSRTDPRKVTTVINGFIGRPATISRNGRYLVRARFSGLQLVNLDSKTIIANNEWDGVSYHDALVTSDGLVVLAYSDPWKLEVWLPYENLTRKLNIPDAIGVIALADNGQFALTGRHFFSTGAEIWATEAGMLVKKFAIGKAVMALAMSDDNSTALAAYNGGAEVVDVRSQRAWTVDLHSALENLPESCAMSADGSQAALGYRDGSVALLDTAAAVPIAWFRLDAPAKSIVIANDGELIVGDSLGRVHVLIPITPDF